MSYLDEVMAMRVKLKVHLDEYRLRSFKSSVLSVGFFSFDLVLELVVTRDAISSIRSTLTVMCPNSMSNSGWFNLPPNKPIDPTIFPNVSISMIPSGVDVIGPN